MMHCEGVKSAHGSTDYFRNEERSRRGERNEARAIAIYVCRRLAGMRQGEIAAAFGVSGYSAVSSAVGRMQGEIEKGGEIVSRFQRIQQLLQR